MTQARRALGGKGEALAASWYQARGYEVLDRNWRRPAGELDLVLRKDSTVVFCEVKSRSSAAFGLPAEAVGPVKQGRIRRLALLWLSETVPGPVELRFDVVGVLGDDIEVIEAAF